jgi:hypothetical protein
MSDAISKAIEAIDNAAAFIKTFGHYPMTAESLHQSSERLKALQHNLKPPKNIQALQSEEPVAPNNCRMKQKARGEPYPKSGCFACGDGGLRGCPYTTPQPVVDVTGMDEEDAMFTQIETKARATYRRHSFSAKGQIITRADDYESHLVWAAIDWAKANAHQEIPEGYVIVPVEPTAEMIDAALAVAFAASVHGKGGWNNYLTALYKALLSAGKENNNAL